MPDYSHTLDVAASPDQVFAVLEDPARAAEWQPGCTRMETATPGPVRVGTELRYFFEQGRREGKMLGQVTAMEPSERFTMHFTDKMMNVVVDFEGVPEGAGTRLTHTISVQPSGLARLMSPLIARGLPRQTITAMERIRDLADAEPRTGG